jgi:hypothetical protein
MLPSIGYWTNPLVGIGISPTSIVGIFACWHKKATLRALSKISLKPIGDRKFLFLSSFSYHVAAIST